MANASPAQIQERLGGINYPPLKQDPLEHVRKGGSEEDGVMEILSQLPDKEYNFPVDVTKEVGKIE